MIRINLLPSDLRPQPQVRLYRILIALGIFVAVAGLVAGGYGAWKYRQDLITDIDTITQRRIELGPLYDKVIVTEQTLAIIEKQVANRQQLVNGLLDPVGLMKSIEGTIPQNVAYSSFSVTSQRQITMSGAATDYYGVAALQLKLSLDGRFANIVMQNASKYGPSVAFNMSCIFNVQGATP